MHSHRIKSMSIHRISSSKKSHDSLILTPWPSQGLDDSTLERLKNPHWPFPPTSNCETSNPWRKKEENLQVFGGKGEKSLQVELRIDGISKAVCIENTYCICRWLILYNMNMINCTCHYSILKLNVSWPNMILKRFFLIQRSLKQKALCSGYTQSRWFHWVFVLNSKWRTCLQISNCCGIIFIQTLVFEGISSVLGDVIDNASLVQVVSASHVSRVLPVTLSLFRVWSIGSCQFFVS